MYKPRALTSLSILFPCHDEEGSVGSVIEQSVKTAEEYGIDYEVIVVDDASRDRTAEIVGNFARKNPRVRLVQNRSGRGYGAAVRTGFNEASKDLVLLTDGDGQFQISDIEKLFSKIDGADAVVGFRLTRKDPVFRRFAGTAWNESMRVLLRLKTRDVGCAFKLFRRRALQDLRLKSDHLLIHAEILARLRKAGRRVEEIGVNHYPRTSGKGMPKGPGQLFRSAGEFFKLYGQIR
jgi:glycosyltransferase involved in cell wall biosynthesis